MRQADVEEFAVKMGYETAEYLCEWNGFHCYEPILVKGRISYVGLPLLILEDSAGNIRMSTAEEAMQQLDDSRTH